MSGVTPALELPAGNPQDGPGAVRVAGGGAQAQDGSKALLGQLSRSGGVLAGRVASTGPGWLRC